MSPDDNVTELTGPLIKLDELVGEGPFRLALALSQAWAQEALADTDAEAIGGVRVAAELSEQPGKSFLLRGDISAEFRVPCARCLAPSRVDASAELCVSFIPELEYRKEQAEMGEIQDADEPFSLSDSDRLPYRGRELSLQSLLAEQVLVAYPMRALCERGEACAGLCGHCGGDLNAMSAGEIPTCRCASETEDGAAGDLAATEQQKAWQRALRQFGDRRKD